MYIGEQLFSGLSRFLRRRCEINEMSVTSAVRYSRIAALYTAAVAPTLPWLVVLDLRCLWIRPTGNCSDEKEHLVQRNKGFTGLSVRDGHQPSNLCDVWLLACVSTAEEMNEFQWTNLQSCSLRARNSFRLGLPGVFTCLTTSLENTNTVSEFTATKSWKNIN